MTRKIILTIILLSFIRLNIFSQTIKGRVLNTDNTPLSFSTIIIQAREDSTFVTGGITDSLGYFSMKIPTIYNNSDMIARFSMLGYTTCNLPFKNNMGNVIMKPESLLLKEVTIKGSLPKICFQNGAIINKVQGTILANMGTIEDIITRLPFVIKRDGQFFVLGKGVPLIYINNKKVVDMSELDLLHPSDIKNISIYNSPNVQYDASCKAIIKIETLKNRNEGLNVNANLNLIQSAKFSNKSQLDLRYQYRNLSVFGLLSYKLLNKKGTDRQNITAESDTLWEQESDNIHSSKEKELRTQIGLNYDINANNAIGMSYSNDCRLRQDKHANYTSRIWADKNIYDLLTVHYYEDVKNKPTHQAELYYTGKVGIVKIDAGLEYYNHAYTTNDINNESSLNYTNRVVESSNDVKNSLVNGKVVIEHPLFDGMLSYGFENTYVNRHDDYLSHNNITPTTYSDINERNNSYFAKYSRNTSIGDFAIGLRYEYTDFDYKENADSRNNTKRTMHNFFPSFLWEKNFGDLQLQLSYSTSITRPTYAELSNNIRYINRFTWQTGNPMLKPAYTHDVTLNGIWNFLQLDISYQLEHNAIIYWGNQLLTNSSTTIINYINNDKVPHLSVSLSAQPTIGCWHPMFDVGMDKQWLLLNSMGMLQAFKKPSFYANFENLIELSADMMLNADMSFVSKGHNNNTYNNRDMFICNFGIIKYLMKKTLAIELKMNDVFYDIYNSGVISLGQSIINENGQNDTRNVMLSLRYKFNKTGSKYKGRGVDIEKLNRF